MSDKKKINIVTNHAQKMKAQKKKVKKPISDDEEEEQINQQSDHEEEKDYLDKLPFQLKDFVTQGSTQQVNGEWDAKSELSDATYQKSRLSDFYRYVNAYLNDTIGSKWKNIEFKYVSKWQNSKYQGISFNPTKEKYNMISLAFRYNPQDSLLYPIQFSQCVYSPDNLEILSTVAKIYENMEGDEYELLQQEWEEFSNQMEDVQLPEIDQFEMKSSKGYVWGIIFEKKGLFGYRIMIKQSAFGFYIQVPKGSGYPEKLFPSINKKSKYDQLEAALKLFISLNKKK